MTQQGMAKKERVIEAVRRRLEGDAAVEFLHESGFAMTNAGIAKHLKSLGGRGAVEGKIAAGKSNVDVLQEAFPGEDFAEFRRIPPDQPELFENADAALHTAPTSPLFHPAGLMETTKVSVRIPNDLFEALRLAAKAEHKTQSQLITEILTHALSNMPERGKFFHEE